MGARASLRRLDVSLAANDIGGPGVTKRIELGTNMLLLPLHHPLRVAEHAAMVDVMSGGRLRLGVSAGYSPADLQAFAVPPDARARRMREGLLLIRAVFGGQPVSLVRRRHTKSRAGNRRRSGANFA
jgi:alkanesulfonate monooxygenase SsuD/methylene tetrahydromethanopterin reductase-like flavin-dependent oxidoreductase (luciferase family)